MTVRVERSGNSVEVPLEVLVASSVTKSGTTISGNTVKIVVVQVNPGYDPNAGSTSTGTIVGTFCQ